MKTPLVDCPRGGRARRRQRPGGHEQRVQEQPSHLVLANFRHPPHTDWAQLNSAGGAPIFSVMSDWPHRPLDPGSVPAVKRGPRVA